ncbi:MAG: AMP-binding protein [Yoonia sp.]|nr:AMP-binding protein [Yoonia sp.]
MTLRDRLFASFEAYAALPAVWVNDETYTYADLHAKAAHFALALDAKISATDVVGIYAQHDLDSIVGIIGTILSGRRYLPLNPNFPIARHTAICTQEPPAAIICSPRHEKRARILMEELSSDQILLNGDGDVLANGGQSGTFARPQLRDPSTVYSMFTSGTTGTPKGVRILESNLLAYLDGIAPIANIGPHDRATHFFELSFDLSVHDIFVTLTSGAQLTMLPGKMKLAIADFVAERDITHWFSVPSLASFCQRIGQLTPDTFAPLRTALFCGEALPVALAEAFSRSASAAKIWNLYGPTEATIAVTGKEFTGVADMDGEVVVPLGGPIGTQVCTIEGDGNEGQLQLGGSQVTRATSTTRPRPTRPSLLRPTATRRIARAIWSCAARRMAISSADGSTIRSRSTDFGSN